MRLGTLKSETLASGADGSQAYRRTSAGCLKCDRMRAEVAESAAGVRVCVWVREP